MFGRLSYGRIKAVKGEGFRRGYRARRGSMAEDLGVCF